MVRSPSGVTLIRQRPVGAPPTSRSQVKVGADRLHVVGKDLAKLVVRHLADEGGAAAEAGDPGDGVAGRAAGGLDRRAHARIERRRAGVVDQHHRALDQALARQEVLRAGAITSTMALPMAATS